MPDPRGRCVCGQVHDTTVIDRLIPARGWRPQPERLPPPAAKPAAAPATPAIPLAAPTPPDPLPPRRATPLRWLRWPLWR